MLVIHAEPQGVVNASMFPTLLLLGIKYVKDKELEDDCFQIKYVKDKELEDDYFPENFWSGKIWLSSTPAFNYCLLYKKVFKTAPFVVFYNCVL